MTIRRGGGPRDGHSQAHPLEPGSYDDAPWPARDPRRAKVRRSDRRLHGQNGGGGGLGGALRFLVFALVLAAIVLGAFVAVLRPLAAAAVVGWAYDNPGALRVPFVADLVREDLGAALTDPASEDPSEVTFEVVPGDTPRSLAPRLVEAGLVRDQRAFVFQATLRDLGPKLQAGAFRLTKNMTPDQVVTGLIENRIVITVVDVTFREGLRLEQITAKLQTLEPPLSIDPAEFYEAAKNPSPQLLEDYPWLKEAGLPDGASLEGFLAPATYQLTPESTADDLLRQMLDRFHRVVGDQRMAVAGEGGTTFYELLTLASIVEREAVLEEERSLIAGVYQNRLDALNGVPRILNADPTVFYALDTLELEQMPFEDWRLYSFWVPPGRALADVDLPAELQGYQSYRVAGLPPGPICTPHVTSIDAALEPDTTDGYLYFLAIPGGDGAHVFAKSLREHNENRKKYGYN